jgi:hypothetical protein
MQPVFENVALDGGVDLISTDQYEDQNEGSPFVVLCS